MGFDSADIPGEIAHQDSYSQAGGQCSIALHPPLKQPHSQIS